MCGLLFCLSPPQRFLMTVTFAVDASVEINKTGAFEVCFWRYAHTGTSLFQKNLVSPTSNYLA
jgi:hypothetical protein